MIIDLADAMPGTAGAKAAVLGRLIRAGFPVPPGFVIPLDAYRSAIAHLNLTKAPSNHIPPATDHPHASQLVESQGVPAWLLGEVGEALVEFGDCVVAVRSSATGEDSPMASAAGQYDSYLGVQGSPAVVGKVQAIWDSLWSPRAVAYRQASGETDDTPPAIAVIVQQQVHADVAGVLFTADPRMPAGDVPTGVGRDEPLQPVRGPAGAVVVMEASWGLGESVVQGVVTPDTYVVSTSDASTSGLVTRRLGTKLTRRDAVRGVGIVISEVAVGDRERFCLDEQQVRQVVELGRAVAEELGGPQDIEFAVEGDEVWILQARPITVPLAGVEVVTEEPAVLREGKLGVPRAAEEQPGVLREGKLGVLRAAEEPPGVLREGKLGVLRAAEEPPGVLRGVGGSPGVATGTARVVEGVGDFGRVEVGDILVCRFTDPAWTPLFGVVAGVVTEVGGRLSHAAIVAREHRIPAVLGVPGIMSAVEDGQLITIVGNTGTVSAPGLARS